MEWGQKHGSAMEYSKDRQNIKRVFMFITVGTGRDRKDIASAIVKSIRIYKPAGVVFFCTRKSEMETLPEIEKILQQENLQIQKEVCVIEDENDFEEIKNKCAEVIGKYKGEKIVDYTSGTKAMSVGIVIAGLEKNVELISYITGKRDSSGRVIPGTERFLSMSPSQIYAQNTYRKAIDYFNDTRFELAKSNFGRM